MDIQDAVPAGSAPTPAPVPLLVQALMPTLAPCPRCGRDDRVLAVPAAYGSARSTEATIAHARHVIADDDALQSRKREARAVLAATPLSAVASSELALAPKFSVRGWVGGTWVLGIAAAMMWTFYSVSGDTGAQSPPTGYGFGAGLTASAPTGRNPVLLVAALGFTAGAVASLIAALRSARRRAVVAKGRPAAERVWRRGWYCGRCATVYFLPGEAPEGVAPATAITPPDFQRVVWTTGGYDRERAIAGT